MKRFYCTLSFCLVLGGSGIAAVAQTPDGNRLPVEISTTELSQMLTEGKCVVVDTRDSNAYNGWRLDGVSRGGHIPGAVNFAAGWLDVQVDNKDEILQAALVEKGINREKTVVLCGLNDRDRGDVATFLQSKGIFKLSYYNFRHWADDEDLVVHKFPNYQLLVPPEVVKRLYDGERPESFNNSTTIKFAEVSWGAESKSYDKGHVPGSFHINTDSVEPPPKWMLASDEVLAQFALAHGFVSTDTVILSGEDPTAAYRLAVILRYIGVQDVRVLNGGLSTWKTAGMKLETERHEPKPSHEFGVNIPARPELIDTYREVLKGLDNLDRFTLVDNRTWEEHVGEISGYSYHFKKGRIPGSKFGHAGTIGGSSLSYYRNIDDTMRSADEIRALWKKSEIDTQTHLSFMCGSGWRAAEVLTYANVIGIDDAAIYSDGWIGWSNNPDNPLISGEVPKRVR